MTAVSLRCDLETREHASAQHTRALTRARPRPITPFDNAARAERSRRQPPVWRHYKDAGGKFAGVRVRLTSSEQWIGEVTVTIGEDVEAQQCTHEASYVHSRADRCVWALADAERRLYSRSARRTFPKGPHEEVVCFLKVSKRFDDRPMRIHIEERDCRSGRPVCLTGRPFVVLSKKKKERKRKRKRSLPTQPENTGASRGSGPSLGGNSVWCDEEYADVHFVAGFKAGLRHCAAFETSGATETAPCPSCGAALSEALAAGTALPHKKAFFPLSEVRVPAGAVDF